MESAKEKKVRIFLSVTLNWNNSVFILGLTDSTIFIREINNH